MKSGEVNRLSVFRGIREPDRRVTVVTGHYGSGKTEFSVSFAMLLAKHGFGPYERLGLCDLDIINPYFRSRERKAMLAAAGIPVYGSAYQHDVTAELPELSADVRAPPADWISRTPIHTSRIMHPSSTQSNRRNLEKKAFTAHLPPASGRTSWQGQR